MKPSQIALMTGLGLAVFLLSNAAVKSAYVAQPIPADFVMMQQVHARMQQIWKAARVAALNALTPQHRGLLAQIIGQLAVAPDPDTSAAARQLDAALSTVEARTVTQAAASAQQQSGQLLEGVRARMQSSNPQGVPPPVIVQAPGPDQAAPTDPGSILLMLTLRSLEPNLGYQVMRHP